MSEQELTHALALRIGLASKALADVTPADMLEVVMAVTGVPMTQQKFSTLSVEKLRTAADGKLSAQSREALNDALSVLKDASVHEVPELDAYEDGAMPGSIRVAVASNGAEDLDGHFGSCSRFLIYQVSGEETRLINVRSTAEDVEAEDKTRFRADLLKDCQILYTVSIGGPAAARVVRADVCPIKKPQGGNAREMVAELGRAIAHNPPPWLAKAMGQEAEARVRFREVQ